ncbi:uncharacterized protein VTP21DRAFT_2312 [Calcarisporiella thermophila]|uniref:uncharacterized protein n=1 Tax=Calcarisporiella thermophila TaxID=911321 RepID=UPI0037428576
MNKINHDHIISLEQPFIKAPFEQIRKTLRTSQRHFEKEFGHLSSNAQELVQRATQDALTKEDAAKAIDTMVMRLQGLKRKLNEVKTEEATYTSRCKVRLDRLQELTTIATVNSPEYSRWSRTRLNRVLVDYMLRRGYKESAQKLAQDENIEALVDIELFLQSKKVEEALIARRSCTEALQWCSENKSSLRKMKSTLEFQLRLQEYIELVRTRKLPEAIAYARKHLAPWSDTHLREIQQATALMAFPATTQCPPYKRLYDASRWEELNAQFWRDCFALHSLTPQPLLELSLQAGLSALKTPFCSQPANKSVSCPVCSPELGALAEKLPLSHHVNSTLVCRISGAIMNEDNPPMTLPNGYVYSMRSLKEMAARNGGMVRCPRTGDTFEFTQARKLFIS